MQFCHSPYPSAGSFCIGGKKGLVWLNGMYQLPYTVIRPFNCVGTGEKRALCDTQITSGNVKLTMSHVVPDLVQKVYKGQDPLHILGAGNQVRHYTYGGDLAWGIRLCIDSCRMALAWARLGLLVG